MRMGLKPQCFSPGILVLITLLTAKSVAEIKIEGVSPREIGVNGEVSLTIVGTGFDQNQFSLNDPTKGNRVTLRSTTQAYNCSVVSNGCTEKRVQCKTPHLPAGVYEVDVCVDGVCVTEENRCPRHKPSCQIQSKVEITPTITSVVPRSGPPGSLLTLKGKIFTAKANATKTGNSSNGVTATIRRVYTTGGYCDLVNENTTGLHGVGLDRDYGLTGFIKCKMTSSYVGAVNISYILTEKYGRSKPDPDTLHVTSDGKIAMFMAFAEISSVTPNKGSTEGGTLVTLHGNYLNNTETPPRVYIGDSPCDNVTILSMKNMTCITRKTPTLTNYPGNRGALKETWTNADFADRANLDASSPGYFKTVTDSMESNYTTNQKTVSRLSTYFDPSETGFFSFYIKCDNKCELRFGLTPDSATKVAWVDSTATTYWDVATQKSPPQLLNSTNRYYMEVTHESQDSNSFVKVQASTNKSMVTTHNRETQTIRFNSDVKYEKQELEVTGCDKTQTDFIPEKQTLVINGITDDNSGQFYNVTVFNATTAGIRLSGSAADVERALNDLPGFLTDAFEVEETGTAGKEITVKHDLGGVTPMKVSCPNSVSCSVKVKQAGVSGKNSFRLAMGGLMTPLITCGATASEVKGAVNELFSVKCPKTLKQEGRLEFYDYENDEEARGLGGERTSDMIPFCGQYSMKKPFFIYTAKSLGIKVTVTPLICFAYLGSISDIMNLNYNYERTTTDQQGVTRNERKATWRTITTNVTATEQWRYTCIDLKKLLSELHDESTVNTIYILKVKVNGLYGDEFHVDAVKVAEKTVLKTGEDFKMIPKQRCPLANVDGNQIIVRTVQKSGDKYTIEMAPQNCASKIPLLRLYNSTADTNQDLRTSNEATFTKPTVGGSSIVLKTTRMTAASQQISGQLTVAQGNSTFNLTMDPKCDVKLLQDIGIDGEVGVTHRGDCANFRYQIQWKTKKGELPLMRILDNQVSGDNVRINIGKDISGATNFDPIVGGYLITPNTNPQLRVFINDIPSNCTGDCSFGFDDANTPKITSVSPNSGAKDTELTITGSGFSGTKEHNKVLVGRIPCTVISSVANEIKCTVGNGGGSQPVKLNVNPFGKATATGNPSFLYNLVTNSLTPSSGSSAGGTNITISGSGFSKATVLVDDKICTQVTGTPNTLNCLTPPGTAVGEKVVKVQMGSVEKTLTQKFTYTSAPTLTSVVPMSSSVSGGAALTLTGSGFGSNISMVTVKIGNKSATVTACEDGQIVATIPDHRPGSFYITVSVNPNGFADNSAIAKFEYILRINNISPNIVSVNGGALLTVSGSGFGTDPSKLSAKAGPYNCTIDINGFSNTQFQCNISRTRKHHAIDNQGSTSEYGKGYRWNPSKLHVKVGDCITWNWNAPYNMDGIAKYGVHYGNCSEPIQQPLFTSGEQTSKGNFSYCVTTPGNYFYNSGFVDEAKRIIIWGLIVAKPVGSSDVHLTVQRDNYTASYAASNRKRRSSTSTTQNSCPALTLPANCPTQTSGSNTLSLNTCLSCKVTSISKNSATSEEEIILRGTNFGSQNCQNKIKFGNYHCQPVSSTTTEVKCKVQPNGNMEVGIPMKISFDLSNRGFCNIAIPNQALRQFTLLPHVKTCNPQKSSELGGARLTIQGGGFVVGKTTVNIGGKKCEKETVTYSQITCDIPKADKIGSTTTEVKVKGITVPNTCIISYTKFDTPEVKSVSPLQTSKLDETITIDMNIDVASLSTVEVFIGQISCTVQSKVSKQIICLAKNLPVGEHEVHVKTPSGKAKCTYKVKVDGIITLMSPSTGSINGGTSLTLTGNGFVKGKTEVKIGASICNIKHETLTEIQCLTLTGTGTSTVTVVSNLVSYTSQSQLSFTYQTGSSPHITAISQISGKSGDKLTITGTNFGSTADVLVGVPCAVTSIVSTKIICTLGDHSAADVNVMVSTANGRSNNKTFSYSLSASISSQQGCFGGGHKLTITGHGFNITTTSVTICGTNCTMSEDKSQLSRTQLVCYSPSQPMTGTTDKTCEVKVTENGKEKKLTYDYSFSKTPSISSVSPNTVTKNTPTTVTITGTNFGSDKTVLVVSIGGQICTISTITTTEIVCVTTTVATDSKKAIDVTKLNCGNAVKGSFNLTVVQLWSAPGTWGGQVPQKDEFIVINKGATILLDVDTPILKFLLINGGTLMFDERKVDLTLKSEFILITGGGLLQVGTEDKPYLNKATVELHGHPRTPELPVYGTKTLAVRNGTLDLHGKHIGLTWTKLSKTAYPGNKTIHLKHSVNWSAGDKIVIATTGGHTSQKESELRSIKNVLNGGTTLELDKPLNYTHVATSEKYGNTEVELAAEVGLLTHNVVVRGSDNDEFHDKIEKCEDGFNTGEFAIQTCFQGRFGDEVGSDEFGGAIMIHSPAPKEGSAIARLEYIELTHVGQAFRLGRYPVHFHINGNISQSYVRGCSIHKSFNRAVNIHASPGGLIEHNVIYNIKGGALFLEDGVETGNIIQYNLAIFVKSSTSLLNDDITPAAFWVTNANNSVKHNAAAGGTHFGYWIAPKEHPEGPSYDVNVCPDKVPIDVFHNNSAHSQGWFGLWIFPNYDPKEGGSCSDSAPTAKANFSNFIVWHCEKGAEAVNVGSVTFTDFSVIQNLKAGIEWKLTKFHSKWNNISSTPSLVNATIIAYSSNLNKTHGTKPSQEGLVLPQGGNLIVDNITLKEFHDNSCAITYAKIDGTCTSMCGGFHYFFLNTTFINSTCLVRFDHRSQGVIMDVDGSITGTPNQKVVPESDIFPQSSCHPDNSSSLFSKGEWNASICDDKVDFHRIAINEVTPDSLDGISLCFTNDYGTICSPFLKKRITHPNGYMALLVSKLKYNMHWENYQHVSNISFQMRADTFDKDKFVIICQHLEVKPDRFLPDGIHPRNESKYPLNISNVNADWTYNSTTKKFCFIVSSNVTSKDTRQSHNGMPFYDIDRVMAATVYKCQYPNCKPPPDPNTVPQNCTRPDNAVKWSKNDWKNTNNGKEASNSKITGTASPNQPQKGDNVTIPEGTWLVLDVLTPELDILFIYGVLEVDNNTNLDYSLKLNHIYIRGGSLIIGCNKTQRFEKNIDIILKGNHSSPVFPPVGGPNVGAKSIGVFGGFYLHGKYIPKPWTKLLTPLSPGSNEIKVVDVLTGWSENDEIVITTTSTPEKSEVFTIKQIHRESTYTNITLNMTAKYMHKAFTNTISGISYEVRAEVGLLTHNIKITGEPYPNMVSKGFGMRVIAGVAVTGETLANMKSYSAKVKVDGVQFRNGGQLGFNSETDPRFTLALLQVPDLSSTGFYVERCSFQNSFSTAVGVFGTSNVTLSHNVIHHTVDIGILTTGKHTRIVSNLISLTIFSGGYHDRFEKFRFTYPAALTSRIEDTEIYNNSISGSDRTGFNGISRSTNKWSGNIVRSNLIGFGWFPDVPEYIGPDHVWIISGISFILNYDFGIYYNQWSNLTISNCVFVENGVAMFVIAIGPSAVDHIIQPFNVNITNNLIVGTTSTFDCDEDRLKNTDKIFKLSELGRGFGYKGGFGKFGIALPTYTTGSNSAPTMDFISLHSYNSLEGETNCRNNIFADFINTKCGKDVMITLNPNNDDANHPAKLANNTAYRTPKENLVYLNNPRLKKVNSADCIDMACDGHKQVILHDDGSLLGKNGTVVSNAAFEYDGDARYGLGDYRIPKTAQSNPDGSRVDMNKLAPKKGIVRDSSCKWISSWNAYNCTMYKYRYLVIESMDADTETRRLSPIAFFSNEYVDLLNGPQDHGWCSGYTCRKRLSTFLKVVVMGSKYESYMTGTAPQHIRYMVLDSTSKEKLLFGMFFKSPQRMDVYMNGVFQCPTNADCNSNGITYKQGPVINFMPQMSGNCGDNYFDREKSIVYMLFCGGGNIFESKLHTQIFLGFDVDPVSEDEFFGENLVNNLASLLNIPRSKIRNANTYTNTRKKRSTGSSVVYYVYIGNPPCQGVDCNDVNSTLLTYTDLTEITVDLINKYQLGELADLLNVTINGLEITEAMPDVEDPLWAQIVSNETNYVYDKILQVPTSLVIQTPPVADTEGNAFTEQPRLQMLDSQGLQIINLGATNAPWQIQATLRTGTGSNAFADLVGNTTINFVNGWANFTNLGISLSGTGYIIDFEVIYPDGANFSLPSDPITVNQRQLIASVVSVSTDTYEGGRHEVIIEIRDNKTGEAVVDIGWSNLNWHVNTTLVSGSSYTGSLSGVKSATFNLVTSRATFSDITVDEVGMAVLEFAVYSSPPQYEFSVQKGVVLYPTELASVVQDTIKQVSVKFDLDFAVFGNDKFAAMFANVFLVRYRYLKWSDVTVSEGSVIITMTLAGNSASVDIILTDLCDSIKNGSTFTYEGNTYTMADYMTVDGSNYYTSSCVIPDTTIGTGQETTGSSVNVVMIVCLVIGVILLAFLILAFILWKLIVYPKTKTHKSSTDVNYLGGKGAFFFKDAFYRQDTFNSIRSENSFVEDRQCAPANTVYSKKKGMMTISSHY